MADACRLGVLKWVTKRLSANALNNVMWIFSWLAFKVPQYGGLPVVVNLFIVSLVIVHALALIVWMFMMLHEFATGGRLASLVDTGASRKAAQRSGKWGTKSSGNLSYINHKGSSSGDGVSPSTCSSSSSSSSSTATTRRVGVAGIELSSVVTVRSPKVGSGSNDTTSSGRSTTDKAEQQQPRQCAADDDGDHHNATTGRPTDPSAAGLQQTRTTTSTTAATAMDDDEPVSYFSASPKSTWASAAFGRRYASGGGPQSLSTRQSSAASAAATSGLIIANNNCTSGGGGGTLGGSTTTAMTSSVSVPGERLTETAAGACGAIASSSCGPQETSAEVEGR